MSIARRETRRITAGSLEIGSGSPVSVQTMWPDSITEDRLPEIIKRMRILKEYGCDIMRFTVADEVDIPLLGKIAHEQIMPVVADVHYDYTFAVKAIEAGVDKVRINPGTIGALWKTREIIHAAQHAGIAVRLGLNGGSLPKKYKDMDPVQGMLLSCEEYINIFEQEGFSNLVVSLKASDPEVTYKANHEFAQKNDYPLHIGVTEAGPLIPSVVKSTYALSRLLGEGIGDTVRVSISDSMEKEIVTAREILKMLGLSPGGIRIISCPKCGRATFDTHKFMERFEDRLHRTQKSVTIAAMGCTVNGLDEARHADLGITGVGRRVCIFKHGEIIREVDPADVEEAFFEELEKYE